MTEVSVRFAGKTVKPFGGVFSYIPSPKWRQPRSKRFIETSLALGTVLSHFHALGLAETYGPLMLNDEMLSRGE